MISGERYHLDPTRFERLLFLFYRVICEKVSFVEMACLSLVSFELCVSLALRIESLTRFELPLPEPIQLLGNVLASPKSQILTLKSLSITMFEGLMSLWIILTECRNLTAQTQL
jgi:hypothetical protein